VGEALLTTPLLTALKALAPPAEVHVLVHPRVARALEGHPGCDRLIPFDRRHLWLGPLAPSLRALRQAPYDAVVDCSNWTAPSTTSALVARLLSPGAGVVGPDQPPARWLSDLAIPPRPDTRRETLQRIHLLSFLPGVRPVEQLSFRAPRVAPPFTDYLAGLQRAPHAVVNPGGRLGARRVPPSAFAAAARALLQTGRTPVVTWGPGEEALAREVLARAPGALLAPPTNLDELAALMQAAGLTVCNNTGPMHLSVAVGAPTLAFFLRMELERWGHPFPPHRMVDLTPAVDAGEDVDALAAREATAFAASLGAAPGPQAL
jgi:ADP-heptose:LPS heptosyltransferase